MATLNKTFPFATTSEGFTAVPGDASDSMDWDSSGNPGGSLHNRIAGRNKTANSYWEWTGTWEDLGISAGSTITQVRQVSHDSQCTEFNVVDAASLGPTSIYDSTGTVLIATLWSGRTITGTEGSWSDPGTQTYQSIGASYQASNTTIRLRLYHDFDLGNNASAVCGYYEDNFNIDIDYTAGAQALTGDDVTGAPATVDDPTISQTIALTGDDVTGGIPTVGDGTINQVTFPIIAKTYTNSGGTSPTTTTGIDTTGANFLMVAVSWFGTGSLPTIADSKGNTWQSTNYYDNVDSSSVMIFYCYNPTVGTNHTVTVTHSSTAYASVFFYAFDGLDTTSSVYDGDNGSGTNTSSYSTTYTPSVAGSLLVSVYCVFDEETITPDPSGGFILEDWDPYVGSITPGGAVAFINDYDSTSQASVTWDVGSGNAVMIAAFLPPSSVQALTGDDVTGAPATVDDPTISQTIVLTGDDVFGDPATVDDGTISQTIPLTGDDVFGDPATVDDGTISQTIALIGDDVFGDPSTIDDPTIFQPDLLGDDVFGDASTVSDPTIFQPSLQGDDVFGDASTVSDPTISQAGLNELTGDDVTGAPTTIDDPYIYQPALTGDDVFGDDGTVSDPVIFQPDLVGDDVTGEPATVSDPTISQAGLNELTGDDIFGGISTVSDATISQVIPLIGDDILGDPATVSDPIVSQAGLNELTGDDIFGGDSTVSDATISQIIDLSGDDIFGDPATVSDPTISQTQLLTGDDIFGNPAVISNPLISQPGLIFNLIGEDIFGDPATVSDPVLLVGERFVPEERIYYILEEDRITFIEYEDRITFIEYEDRTEKI